MDLDLVDGVQEELVVEEGEVRMLFVDGSAGWAFPWGLSLFISYASVNTLIMGRESGFLPAENHLTLQISLMDLCLICIQI
jgi:hypothetical protein